MQPANAGRYPRWLHRQCRPADREERNRNQRDEKHPIVLYGLRHLFAGEHDITVAAACLKGEEAMAVAVREAPDVDVMDADLPDTSGLEFLRAFHKGSPGVNIVVFTGTIRGDMAAEVISLGVRGIVLKELPPEVLVRCVREVHAGHQWIERHVAEQAFQAMLAGTCTVSRRARSIS